MELVVHDGAGNTGWCCDEPVLYETDRLVLDLSGIRFVSPLCLVRLRAWLDHHGRQGTHVRVVPPSEMAVQNYMSRMQ
jgi:hypothetical protein